MFKIAYCAGHYLGTPGKRVPKALDKSQTREWTLNDRVARYFNEAALQYEDVQTLRTDDATGKKEIKIKDRTAAANKWGANLYLDLHHNAGILLGNGGGVVAFSYPKSAKGKEYRDAIYNTVIAAGALKGNRSQPLREKAYDSLRLADSPAVLIEYGFMDSRTDAPVILTEEYARVVGYATMAGIAKVAGLRKKQPAPAPEPAEELCTVQLDVLKNGAEGATVESMQQLLLAKGYEMKNGKKTYGADGKYGAATKKAVEAFQEANGLPVTGICDGATWSKLIGGDTGA